MIAEHPAGTESELVTTQKIIRNTDNDRTRLLDILQAVQKNFGCVSIAVGLSMPVVVDKNDQITAAHLLVATTTNNEAIKRSVKQVAVQYLPGKELTVGPLNHVEVGIRGYCFDFREGLTGRTCKPGRSQLVKPRTRRRVSKPSSPFCVVTLAVDAIVGTIDLRELGVSGVFLKPVDSAVVFGTLKMRLDAS